MKATGILALALALMLTLGACGSGPASSASTPPPAADSGTSTEDSAAAPAASEALEEVTLKIAIPGDRPVAMDAVLAEAEARMKDTINVKLDMVFVPWSDIASKTQVMLAGGENLDLIFDAPWNHMSEMISAGYYAPLDDLVAQYGPNLLEKRGDAMINANKVGGVLYGLPLGVYQGSGRIFQFRGDIREELGLAPIENYEDFVKYLYAAKAAHPEMIGLTTNNAACDMSVTQMRMDHKDGLAMRHSPALGQSIILNMQKNDPTVQNLFDEMVPAVWDEILSARKLYTDGIIDPDLLATSDYQSLLSGGKSIAAISNDLHLNYPLQDQLQQSFPDAHIEWFTEWQMEPKANYSNFQQGNYIFVPQISKNKERAIMFLNWANGEQANYDLLAYGIEGENWEPVGEKQYKAIGTNYSYFPFAWLWNPVQERLDGRWTQKEVDIALFCMDSDNFTQDVLTGFFFDATPVANEMALYSNLESKYVIPLMNGMMDPDSTWAQLKAEGEAPIKAIQEEAQRQIDAYLAAQ